MRKPILPVRTLDDQLIRDEGWRNKAYPDPLSPAGLARAAGKNDLGLDGAPWTIGVGHTGPEIYQSLEWTDQQVQSAFNADILRAKRELERAFPWIIQLDPTRRGALENMCFNLGVKRLSKFKKMFAALEFLDYETAAHEALDSLWASQVGERAKRLANQLRDGIWY